MKLYQNVTAEKDPSFDIFLPDLPMILPPVLKISKNMEKAAREIVSNFPVPVDAGMFCGRSLFILRHWRIYGRVSYQTPQDRRKIC